MEVHKPKPVHNWREFLNEIGIIVLGVLIALGAEQAAEALHRRAEVAETREALREEVGWIVATTQYSQEEDRCLLTVLDRWRDWAKGGPRPTFTAQPTMASLSTSVWDVAKAGAFAHMPLKERLAYSKLYNVVDVQNSNARDERDAGSRIVAYSQLDRLNADQAQRLLEALNTGRIPLAYKMINAPVLLADAHALGIDPKPMKPAARQKLDALCQAARQPSAMKGE